MEASDIAVLSVDGSIAFYPDADTVAEIADRADVENDFTDRAEVIASLDEYVADIETAMDHFDETDGVLHWRAPY